MEISVRDIPEMLAETLYRVRVSGRKESSRNGEVFSLQEPLMVTVRNPTYRVLHDPVRDANPFFHVMEFIWMMSGGNTTDWITQFNKRFIEYADLGTNVIHGAYGYRWRDHFNIDQIPIAIMQIRKNLDSRRVVLGMWDPRGDLGTSHNDIPCNTHIYFRVIHTSEGPKLDMLVCNRSNDVIWGMCGANAVHMTLLQELVARSCNIGVGCYRVISNNAHVYVDMKGQKAKELLKSNARVYREINIDQRGKEVPLLHFGENYLDFLAECTDFVNGSGVKNKWLNEVATPMRDIYLERKDGGMSTERAIVECEAIQDLDWQIACKNWLRRRLDAVK